MGVVVVSVQQYAFVVGKPQMARVGIDVRYAVDSFVSLTLFAMLGGLRCPLTLKIWYRRRLVLKSAS